MFSKMRGCKLNSSFNWSKLVTGFATSWPCTWILFLLRICRNWKKKEEKKVLFLFDNLTKQKTTIVNLQFKNKKVIDWKKYFSRIIPWIVFNPPFQPIYSSAFLYCLESWDEVFSLFNIFFQTIALVDFWCLSSVFLRSKLHR